MSGPERKRFLDPAVLDRAVREVAALAKEDEIRLILIGGYAMQLYGSPRLTGDIDFAADRIPERFKGGETLSFGGVRSQSSEGVPVAIVLRDDDFASLYTEAVSRGRRMKGVAALVVRPEHLAAMKMVAGRNGKDDADLEFLIASGAIDLAETRRIVRQHLGPYAAKELDQLVDIIKWKKSTGRL